MQLNGPPRRKLKPRFPRVRLRGSEGLGAVLLIGMLCALLFVPYVWRFETRDHPAREQLLADSWLHRLPGASLLEAFEYRLYDSHFGIGTPEVPPLRDRIAIVAIDQNSLNLEKKWPWPRDETHAEIIDRLKTAGARVIGFDVDFSSRQNPGPNGELSVGDRALIAAVREAQNVVLPTGFDPTQRIQGNINLTSAPFSEDENGNAGLEEETPDIAINYAPPDGDGGARRYAFSSRLSGAEVGSFAALVCAVYQKIPMGEASSKYETSLRRREWLALGNGIGAVPTRQASFEGPDSPQFDLFLLRYRTPSLFATYSYSDVLRNYDEPQMKRLFGDKIVLVGATAVALKDLFPAAGGGQITGVEMHAGAICQLLQNRFIAPPEVGTTLNNLFIVALLSALWPQLMGSRVSRLTRRSQERWTQRKHFKRWQFRVQDTLGFFLTSALAVLPALGFWLICVASFHNAGKWVVAAYPLLAGGASASLAMVYLFTVETAQRRKVIRQVGLYLDPDIMETILAYPEEDYPRPRRTTATVMFTDLQGFTSYSEIHSPDEVVSALNAYMSRLHPIIKKHFGSVDKYIGDAIMAYFGVPLPFDDHAACALQCAIEIQEECVRFRAETGIPFYTRIGLHTGELIAGSIGSQSTGASLINYTVIGDTVNLASRLEAKNKEFGSWILCSRATIEAAPDIALVEVVRDVIKGKSQEVEMCIVRGAAGQPPRDNVWGDK